MKYCGVVASDQCVAGPGSLATCSKQEWASLRARRRPPASPRLLPAQTILTPAVTAAECRGPSRECRGILLRPGRICQ